MEGHVLGLKLVYKKTCRQRQEAFFSGLCRKSHTIFTACGVSKGPEFVSDDGNGGSGNDDCGGAGVDRWDEIGGGEGVVDSWGDS